MELQGDAKFLFFTMMQAALKLQSMGKNKKDFLEFAKGIWESLELNNPEELRETLQDAMMKDLKDFINK